MFEAVAGHNPRSTGRHALQRGPRGNRHMADMLYDIRDPDFAGLIFGTAHLDRLHTGCRWAEGPVWFDDQHCLIWSDIPNERMLRWTADGQVGVYRSPSRFSNGNTRDREGRLITCEHGSRSVTRTEPDGSITTLASHGAGARLNSPNDAVVSPDGAVWFSDPSYGILSDYEGFRAPEEQPGRFVWRIDPATGAVDKVADGFNQPNGLAFSPDFRRLYIADSGASHDQSLPRHLRAFDVDGARLTGGAPLCTIDVGIPDGLRVDSAGRIWCSAGDGVHCFAPDGRLLGKILVPEVVANLCFGGPRRNRLFITATTSLYAVYTTATGTQLPARA